MKIWTSFSNLSRNGERIVPLEIKRLMTFLEIHHVSFRTAQSMRKKPINSTICYALEEMIFSQ